jgi:hypothetical protein
VLFGFGQLATGDSLLTTALARFEQYEVWEFNHGQWVFVASFVDFEIANTLARRRTYRVRLMRVTYEDGKPVEQDVLAEIGATRRD